MKTVKKEQFYKDLVGFLGGFLLIQGFKRVDLSSNTVVKIDPWQGDALPLSHFRLNINFSMNFIIYNFIRSSIKY